MTFTRNSCFFSFFFAFLLFSCPSLAMDDGLDIEFGRTYALKSISSEGWLDCRGGDTQTVYVADKYRTPKDDTYLQWTITEVDGNYTLRGIASKCYLDCRGGDTQDAIVTDRNPKGDTYLQWNIIKVDGNYALRGIASKCYLDGRGYCGNLNYTGQNVIVTDRHPKGDSYLQWQIIKLPLEGNSSITPNTSKRVIREDNPTPRKAPRSTFWKVVDHVSYFAAPFMPVVVGIYRIIRKLSPC